MRDNIILKCTECGEENYINTKNKRNHPDRMEVNKYCPRCNKKTVHKEKNKPRLIFYYEKKYGRTQNQTYDTGSNGNQLLYY